MANCKYCHRKIPDESKFCAYCGKRDPVKGWMNAIKGASKRIKQRIDEKIPVAKTQFSNFLEDLTQRTKRSKLPSFVNREKVVSVLQDLKSRIDVETDEEKVKEYTEWASIIEQSISGDNCIVCLKPFSVKNKAEQVLLCPSCHYAAHYNHFLTWIKNRPVCPICKTDLSEEDLIKGELTKKADELLFSTT